MNGAVWAAASGIGFGVFQSLNRRAVAQIDVQLATLLQLVIAAVVLAALAVATTDVTSIADASAFALSMFVLGGLTHFFVGWTLLNASQKRIGAARTSPLLAMTPLFGVGVAFVTLGEVPGALAWIGIGLMTLGAWLVGFARAGEIAWRDSALGLGCAAAWSVSPVLIREGLDGLDSPLLGLTVGLLAAIAAYGIVLAFRPLPATDRSLVLDALDWKLVAGIFVALSTWARWVAIDKTGVGIVLALGLMSVPIVLLLAPVVSGRDVEQVTGAVWLGGALVVGGSLLLIARTL